MTLNKDEHTVKRYDQELAALRSLVLDMGERVQDQIARAIRALDDEDVSAAREVIARDQSINALEVKADAEVTQLIIRRQPMGSDLRLIISLYRSVTDLERIGDEAERIARMVIRIYGGDASPPSNRLFRDVVGMSHLALEILRGSLEALTQLDVEKAIEIVQGDRELDNEFQSNLRRLITFMMEDIRTIGHGIDVIFMLKSLERIGDHAKNIAEYVIYLVKGKDVRHTNQRELEKQVRGALSEGSSDR